MKIDADEKELPRVRRASGVEVGPQRQSASGPYSRYAKKEFREDRRAPRWSVERGPGGGSRSGRSPRGCRVRRSSQARCTGTRRSGSRKSRVGQARTEREGKGSSAMMGIAFPSSVQLLTERGSESDLHCVRRRDVRWRLVVEWLPTPVFSRPCRRKDDMRNTSMGIVV